MSYLNRYLFQGMPVFFVGYGVGYEFSFIGREIFKEKIILISFLDCMAGRY